MIESRIAEKCQPIPFSGCVVWTGYSTTDGYGRIRHNGGMKMTHRICYELAFGPIPPGMFVCHRCDVRSCCNPDHLFLGSNRDNIDDMIRKKRQSKGVSRPYAKLNDESAREILKMREAGETFRSIASKFGVASTTVLQVVSRTHWKHI